MLLAFFQISYKKVFELVLTGNNTKNTKNTVVRIKYKKYSIFVKNVDVSEKLQIYFQFFLNYVK